MPEPLDGIKVVELALAIQGPAAGLYLREMGAEVIKVEPPIGDASRYIRAKWNETPDDTISPQFASVNRGKRSLCIDLTTLDGRNALARLLLDADVFLTNYREAALEKMGLGYTELRRKHPKLVYASVNGFGPRGPDAHKAMLDGVAAARGGLLHHTGYPDRAPCVPGAIVVDFAGAMQLALGIMTALFAREKSGMAQRVQTSALGTTLWLQQWELTHTAMTGAALFRDGNHHANIQGFYGVYRTRDDGFIMLAQVMDQQGWDSLCIFADALELSWDPRFQTSAQRLGEGLSEEDSNEIRRVLTDAFAGKTTEEWVAFLYTQPEIIWERVRSWQEVLSDEQNRANDYLTSVHMDGVGKTKAVGNLVQLSETPGSVKGDPPELGEGNEEILARIGIDANTRAGIEAHAANERETILNELRAAAAAVEIPTESS